MNMLMKISTATPIATRPRTVERESGSTVARAAFASMTRHYVAAFAWGSYRQTTAYRQATIAGRSTGAPASIETARRTNCACDHASGVALRVPLPGVAAVPLDGGRPSQTC